ncbi:hypothetical protein FRC03_000945 [Tulasnella sp. 419]|nr:hypothetical protein FRC03_000945 [Tulasnella sp. 419]
MTNDPPMLIFRISLSLDGVIYKSCRAKEIYLKESPPYQTLPSEVALKYFEAQFFLPQFVETKPLTPFNAVLPRTMPYASRREIIRIYLSTMADSNERFRSILNKMDSLRPDIYELDDSSEE